MATVTNSSLDFSIEPTIATKLQRVRSLKRAIGIVAVLFVGLSLLIVAMMLAMGIDWLTLPGNVGWRPWLTAAVLTGTTIFTIRGLTRILKRENLLRRAASDVDQSMPGLQERWSTLTDTSLKGSNGDVHPAMFRLLSKEGADWAPTVEPVQVISLKSLFKAMGLTALAAIVFAIVLFCDFELTSVLFRRFWLPTSNITMTQFAELPTNVVVPQGEALTLEAFLDGRIPKKGTVLLRDETGETKQHVVAIEKNKDKGIVRTSFSYRLSEVDKPFQFQYAAGDAQTNWIPVEVAKRPKISSVQFNVIPPKYTNRPEVRRKEFPASAKIFEGSILEVAFRTEQELKEFQLSIDEKNSVALQRGKDGWYHWRTTINEDISLTPVPVEAHGLKEKRSLTCHIRVVRDQAPTVKVLSPSSDAAVLPDESIDIHVAGDDDNGISKAELVVFTEKPSADGTPVVEEKIIPIDLGDMKGAKHFESAIKVDLAEYNLKDGDSFRYVVKVYDNRAIVENRVKESPIVAKNLANQNPTTQAPANNEAKQSANPASTTVPNEVKSQTQSTAASAVNNPGNNSGTTQGGTGNRTLTDNQIAQANMPPNPVPSEVPQESKSTTTNSNNSTSTSSSNPAASSNRSALPPEATNPTDPVTGRTDPAKQNQTTPQTLGNTDQTSGKTEPTKSNSDTPMAPKTSSSSSASTGSSSSQSGTPSGKAPTQSNSQPNTSSSQSSSAASNSATGKSDPSSPDPKKDANPKQKPQPTKDSGNSGEKNLIAMSPSKTGNSNSQQTSQTTTNQVPNEATKMPMHEPGKVITPDAMVALKSDDKSKQKPNDTAGGSSAQPTNPLDQRMLDVPQSGSSSRMQIKVDQYAGTYEGQKREKIALAISPILADLDSILTKAKAVTNQVAEQLEQKMPWGADHQNQIDRTEKSLKKAERLVAALQDKSKDTPYAFVGLQINLISQSHITPARESLWEAQQSDVQRIELIRSAWQDISRAIIQLEELNKTFERIHRDQKLADSMQKIKKMYQVYIENSMALLLPSKPGINNDQRKMIEFDVDEEYLKRYKEVLEMRNKLEAELARILRDEEDPRLMRRFMELQSSQADSLRDQISLLAERQRVIGREVKVWAETKVEDRPKLLATIIQMRQLRLNEIATQAAAQNEKFVTWLPLDLAIDNHAFKESLDLSKAVAAAAQLLASSKQEEHTDNANKLYSKLGELDAALRRVDLGVKHEKLVTHLLNRVADVRKLTSLTSAWMKQSQLLAEGNYLEEAAIDQYQLAAETAVAAEKLDRLIKLRLSGGVTADAKIADSLSKKATAMLTTLDTEVSANQLAATHSMRRQLETASVQKEEAAVAAFDKTEKMFDDFMKELLAELDKLPVEDPIASALRDPTLDEILAELEDRNDATRAEDLGIPPRGSNIQKVMDWMRPGRGGNASGNMIRASINQDAKRMQQKIENRYKEMMARIEKEKDAMNKNRPGINPKRRDWNSLLSKLKDGLLQDRGELPPQDYRRAIEQYYSRISRMKVDGNDRQDHVPQDQKQPQDQTK